MTYEEEAAYIEQQNQTRTAITAQAKKCASIQKTDEAALKAKDLFDNAVSDLEQYHQDETDRRSNRASAIKQQLEAEQKAAQVETAKRLAKMKQYGLIDPIDDDDWC